MVRIAERVTPVPCATPLEAQVRELRLITEHAPRYNRRSKYPERHSWVRLTDEAYPRLSVVGAVVAGAAHIGPFASRRTAQEAVHALHDALDIRQCTPRLPLVSRTAGSPCALAGMGRCSAPCVATKAPDTSYAQVADAARRALTGDPTPVVRALSDRIATLAQQERYEEAGEVTRRLRAFVSGAHRAQRLAPLAACAELVAARPSGIGDAPGKPGGWEIVVIKHGRLAATGVSAPGASPLPLVAALRTTAEHVEPPVPPSPAAHPEETDLLLAWLDSPGVRLVHLSDTWACPVRAAGAHAELTWASERVRTEIGTAIGTAIDTAARAEPEADGVPEPENPLHVDTMTAC
jgi:DNA polymerase-3 subunit epsilon